MYPAVILESGQVKKEHPMIVTGAASFWDVSWLWLFLSGL